MVADCQLSDACYERLRVADRLGAVWRQLKFQGFRCAALPADMQFDSLRLRAFGHGDVAHKQAEDALAVSLSRGGRRPQLGEVAGELEDLSLLFGRHGPHCLSFEGCQLGFEILQALHGIVPTLLEGGSDETICGIDGLIAALGEIDLVAGTFDPHAPLRADLVIALFQAGECGECQFDRHRCDGANQPFGNRPIERTCWDGDAGLRSQRLAVPPDALVYRVDATVAGIAHT